ncbi:hypothetical protein HOY80DRAFT_17934 [Tuber brumale]|nr:hypothetical protein HOY80DRAFT_17934 [Tuber brumale]
MRCGEKERKEKKNQQNSSCDTLPKMFHKLSPYHNQYRCHIIARSIGREFNFPFPFPFFVFSFLSLKPVASQPAFKRPADHPQSLFCYATMHGGLFAASIIPVHVPSFLRALKFTYSPPYRHYSMIYCIPLLSVAAVLEYCIQYPPSSISISLFFSFFFLSLHFFMRVITFSPPSSFLPSHTIQAPLRYFALPI